MRRDEADGLREERTERPVPDHHERQPPGGLGELAHALLLGQAPDVEDVWWLVRRPDHFGDRDAARDQAHVDRPERARLLGECGRGADDDPGAAQQPPRERTNVAREGDVRAPELEHDRLARGEGRQGAREPVGVDDVRVAARAARRARERREEERNDEQLPGGAAKVVDDAGPVGDPVVPEGRRRDDADVDALGAERLHPVAHERPCNVVRIARIRRRQDDDLHSRSPRWCASAAGAAIASSAST